MIIKFNEYINEGLAIGKYRRYHKKAEEVGYRERYKDVFEFYKQKYSGDRNAMRIYLPYEKQYEKSETRKKVEKILKEQGFELDSSYDYVQGNITHPEAKNPSKIGRIISRYNPELSDDFASDPYRRQQDSDVLVCISRHPYDVAGADTDRRWQNCMTLYHYNKYLKSQCEPGKNISHLIKDVEKGSLISFLINKDDRNIKDPLSSISIKPYVNEDDDFIFVPDNRIYGILDEDFRRIVFDWCKEVNKGKEGDYKLAKGLYFDNFER
jgi:uncharacterized protein YcgL (UPF0745 family)